MPEEWPELLTDVGAYRMALFMNQKVPPVSLLCKAFLQNLPHLILVFDTHNLWWTSFFAATASIWPKLIRYKDFSIRQKLRKYIFQWVDLNSLSFAKVGAVDLILVNKLRRQCTFPPVFWSCHPQLTVKQSTVHPQVLTATEDNVKRTVSRSTPHVHHRDLSLFTGLLRDRELIPPFITITEFSIIITSITTTTVSIIIMMWAPQR